MFAKTVFILFAHALLIQSALSQVCGSSAISAAPSYGSTYGLAGPALTLPFEYNGLATDLSGNSLACNGLVGNSLPSANTPTVEITPTTSFALPISSASPVAPNSLVVASENVYEGTLAVGGELPFVGTMGLEGVVASLGSGAVNHACGNGAIRMISQDRGPIASGFGTGLVAAAALAPGNLFGGIGAIRNTAAPFDYDIGLAGLAYPNDGLTVASPATGIAGAYPGGSIGSTYGVAIGSIYGGALAPAATYGSAIAPGVAYGGTGEGNVAVAGELPVAGNIAVAGEFPIMGAVSFGGNVPAAGAVVISGKCACGCGNPYVS